MVCSNDPAALKNKKIKRIFAFGYGQENRGTYVIIEGKDQEDCRNKMINRFGMEWAFVYEFYRLEEIKRAGLKEYA